MNWNSAQLGGRFPITLRFSELVGDIPAVERGYVTCLRYSTTAGCVLVRNWRAGRFSMILPS